MSHRPTLRAITGGGERISDFKPPTEVMQDGERLTRGRSELHRAQLESAKGLNVDTLKTEVATLARLIADDGYRLDQRDVQAFTVMVREMADAIVRKVIP